MHQLQRREPLSRQFAGGKFEVDPFLLSAMQLDFTDSRRGQQFVTNRFGSVQQLGLAKAIALKRK